MFYKLMYRRGFRTYRRYYIRLLCVFVLATSMLSFVNVYCDSYYHYDEAVLLPLLTDDWTCDIRIARITREQAKAYRDIPYTESQYIDGNLDFFLTDVTAFETVHRQIAEIFNQYHYDESHTEDAPTIRVFYGRDPASVLSEDASARYATWVIALLLSAVAMLAMVFVYRDYIKARETDLRVLSAIGTEDRMLGRLFGYEMRVLYLVSACIGIPLGALLAYVFFLVCERVDMRLSNAVYPVFCLRPSSVLLSLVVGYPVLSVAFGIIMKRVRGETPGTGLRFDGTRTRGLYDRVPHRFTPFFRAVLYRRDRGFHALFPLTVLICAFSVFALAAVEAMTKLNGLADAASVAAGIANGSLFLMIALYLTAFHAIIVVLFVKSAAEASAETVRTLCDIGADSDDICACYVHHARRTALISLTVGLILGYGISVGVFAALGYPSPLGYWQIAGTSVLCISTYAAYVYSMKNSIKRICAMGGTRDGTA